MMNLLDTNPKEQKGFRKRFRKRVSLEPEIEVFESPTDVFLGTLFDIHDMGIRLISKTPIAVNRFIKMRLSLPQGISDKEFITFDTISLWNRIDTSLVCSTGFQLLNITEENKTILRSLIEQFARDSAN